MQALAEVTRQSLLQQRTNQINMNVAEAARGHFDAADRQMRACLATLDCWKSRHGVAWFLTSSHCAFWAFFDGERKPLCLVVGSHIGLIA